MAKDYNKKLILVITTIYLLCYTFLLCLLHIVH